MKITFYGVRGSIPVSSKETQKYGGNTSCLLLEIDNKILIFDAGTGIRQLGEHLLKDKRDIYLFFSHYHWDHIQGLPFFKPLYNPKRNIHLLSHHLADDASIVLKQMTPPYFPISHDKIQAQVNVLPLKNDGHLNIDSLNISTCALNHPDGGSAYRIDTTEGSFAYVTDSELLPPKTVNTTWEQWVDFLQDVDLLVHDAMYIDEELSQTHGWGHPLVSQVQRLARDANVAKLVLFHHDPKRTDKQLEAILANTQQWMKKQHPHCQVTLAKEMESYQIV